MSNAPQSQPLLRAVGLTKVFGHPGASLSRRVRGAGGAAAGRVNAVDGVDLDIGENESVGLVGESGSGKTTVARCLLRLVAPTSGSITFDDSPVLELSGEQLMAFRRQAQIVFQDPFASLDPRFNVFKAIAEPLRVHGICPRRERETEAARLLASVGLGDDFLTRYRHELSGGEAQRVSIARALATRPRLLILDEPTSALDASARLKVISLLRQLREQLGITYLVISHDLTIIRYLCERVAVMYLGGIVEDAPAEQLFERPQHPYTEALLSATPDAGVKGQVMRRIRLRPAAESLDAVEGCRLAPRCHHATDECFTRPQRLEPIAAQRLVACHRVTEGQITLPTAPERDVHVLDQTGVLP
jgi:peptide/nickel transport system ATP-binding protein